MFLLIGGVLTASVANSIPLLKTPNNPSYSAIIYLIYNTENDGEIILPFLERKIEVLLKKESHCLNKQTKEKIELVFKRELELAKKLWKELQPEIQIAKNQIAKSPLGINLSTDFVDKATLFQDTVETLELMVITLPDDIKCEKSH